jgi:hypothetical protein
LHGPSLVIKSIDKVRIPLVYTLTNMKLGGVRVGLLINFNVSRLKDGLKRFVL